MKKKTKNILATAIFVKLLFFLVALIILLKTTNKNHAVTPPTFRNAAAIGQVRLGIQVLPVDKQVAKNFSLSCNRGLLVRRVIPDSPAEDSGLREGDVIRRINGTRLIKTEQLVKVLKKKSPGQNIIILINRRGIKKTLLVELEPMPNLILDQNVQLVNGYYPSAAPPTNTPYPYFYFGEEVETD